VAKDRGTAEFSLKDICEELNEEENDDPDQHIKYGVIIDDGDNITER
jgi:hypothetical protein